MKRLISVLIPFFLIQLLSGCLSFSGNDSEPEVQKEVFLWNDQKITVELSPYLGVSDWEYLIRVESPEGRFQVGGVLGGIPAGSYVRDLDDDGSPEIVLVGRSAGSGGYAALVGYESGQGKFIPLGDLPATAEGYRGHDRLLVGENRLVRLYPLYTDEDSNSRPTRGIRGELFLYDEGWILLKSFEMGALDAPSVTDYTSDYSSTLLGSGLSLVFRSRYSDSAHRTLSTVQALVIDLEDGTETKFEEIVGEEGIPFLEMLVREDLERRPGTILTPEVEVDLRNQRFYFTETSLVLFWPGEDGRSETLFVEIPLENLSSFLRF